MKFMLLVNWNEKDGRTWSDAKNAEVIGAHQAFAADLGPRGKLVGGERLVWSDEAVEVRVKNGKPVLRDGPFTETREVLGGFYIVEAADRAEAVSYAARLPEANDGTVVVWPVWEMPEG
jgi:hypothetical protein